MNVTTEVYRRVLAAAAVRAERQMLMQSQGGGIANARLGFDLKDFEAAIASGPTEVDGSLLQQATDYLTNEEFYALCSEAVTAQR